MAEQLSPKRRGPTRDERAMEWPFFVILYLTMAGGYVSALVADRSLREPDQWLLFTLLLVAQGSLYWFGARWSTSPRWWPAYFVVQAGLTFVIGLLVRGHWLALGLYMGLVGYIVGSLWPHVRRIGVAVVVSLGLLALNLIASWGAQVFVQSLPILGLMCAFVLIYVVLFVRQSQARERAQALLSELEVAHQQLQEYAAQVEELTLSQERERMARELHDTLAQGLAGLILQLEAADSHLEGGDPAQAQAVVQQAMRRARTTLHEARRAIKALRAPSLEQGGLVDALRREVEQFSATSGVETAFEVAAGLPDVSPEAAQQILRIVQESLSNVARHAQASYVLVRLVAMDGGLQVEVQDDGVGFDPDQGLARADCFGLAGMVERASRVGGVLRVESARGRGTGTRVVLEIEGRDWKERREGRDGRDPHPHR